MIKAPHGFRHNHQNGMLNDVFIDVPREVADDLGLELS